MRLAACWILVWVSRGLQPPLSPQSTTTTRTRSLEATKKKSQQRPASTGFGAKPVEKKKKKKSSLLEAEDKFLAMEKKYDGVSSDYVLREFVVAVRCPENGPPAVRKQLRDWVPVVTTGIATVASSKDVLPLVLKKYKREILEATRLVLSGPAAKQATQVEVSYEVMPNFYNRIMPALEATAKTKKEDLENAKKVLGLDEDVDMAQVKAAYRRLMKDHHPDMTKNKNNTDAASMTVALQQARDLLIESLSTKTLDYVDIGANNPKVSNLFKGPLMTDPLDLVVNEDDMIVIPSGDVVDSAVTRLDETIVVPFLYRNVQNSRVAEEKKTQD